jgi:hypothetical protein
VTVSVVALDLNSGQAAEVSRVGASVGIPGYTGDDSAVLFSQPDPTTLIGYSLVRQPVAADRLTPTGTASVLLRDALAGVVYRRGTWRGPAATATPTRIPTSRPTETPTPSLRATATATSSVATPTGIVTLPPTPPRTPSVLPTATRTGPPASTPTPGACVGDCNGDGEVSVDELIRGVNIALGNAGLGQCPGFDVNGDGEVSVNELVQAVNAALGGCAGTG